MGKSITIARRYRGPEESGNGGYACGMVGALVDAPAAEVTLRLPPPLERPLRVERDGAELRVLHGDELVAEARPLESVDVEPPPPVAFEDAEGGEPAPDHPFPSCFVCGPGREPGDALRLMPKPVGEGRVAAAWRATEEQAGRPELVWAALDCPGAFAVDPGLERGASVLGRLAAEVLDTPRAGERCVVLGWPLPGAEGRKLLAGTAVYGEDGRLLGKARATWIALSAG